MPPPGYGQPGQQPYQPRQAGGPYPPGPPGYPPGQYGYVPPPPPRRPRKRHRGLKITLGVIGAFFLIIIIAGVASGGGSNSGTNAGASAAAAAPAAAQSAAAKAPAKPARRTVTYVVTGSPADVTYGPDGSDLAGTVPMRVTKTLHNPQYYAISAQLNGGGSVMCKILVDGKVISRARASGSYEIADCEISKGLFSGKWEDTNSG
ncbi:MAG: hypothetical protein ACRDPY_17605 [Streptosporangiaceae bacterium]